MNAASTSVARRRCCTTPNLLESDLTQPFLAPQHIMIDLGTGNNNKINWPMEDKQEMIDIIETVYRGASKGRGWVFNFFKRV